MILDACRWLEATPLGVMVRESLYGFPILVAIHILGLTISAGLVVWLDLRLLGAAFTGIPVPVLYRRVMTIAGIGFAVMFVSGGMIVAGFATLAYGNLYFRIKLAALAAAALNAFVYHRVTERTIEAWNRDRRPPAPARLAGLISIVCWTIVILCGRMISYTMYSGQH